MRPQKPHSFQRALQRAMALYALVPMLVLTATGIVLTHVALYRLTEARLAQAGRQAASMLDEVCGGYAAELERLSACEVLSAELEAGSIPPERYRELYDFVNGGMIRGDFFLLNAQREIVGASTTGIPACLTLNGLQTGLIWKRHALRPNRVVLAGGQDRDSDTLLLLHPVGDPAAPSGFLLFSISGKRFFQLLDDGVGMTVADAMYSAVWATDASLMDAYGRIRLEWREADGVYQWNNKQFSLVRNGAYNGAINVYTFSDTSVYFSAYRMVIIAIVAVFAGLLLLLLAASRRVAWRTGGVVNQISQAMERTQYDNLDQPLLINTGDEFEQIAASYNRMCRELRRLIDDNAESAHQQALSEMRQLEAQFNPHFLYNTLETIRVLVKLDPAGANQAILALSALLRYSINNKADSVTLAEDAHYAACYLDIQKYRLQEQLEYQFNVPPETERCVMPKLILQPLVENAVQYGRDEEGRCRVTISVRTDGQRLVIAVRDTGKPLTDSKLASIRRMIETPGSTTGHFGLYNVHKRLRLAYGESYGLSVHRCDEGGNEFIASLPFRLKEDGNVHSLDC